MKIGGAIVQTLGGSFARNTITIGKFRGLNRRLAGRFVVDASKRECGWEASFYDFHSLRLALGAGQNSLTHNHPRQLRIRHQPHLPSRGVGPSLRFPGASFGMLGRFPSIPSSECGSQKGQESNGQAPNAEPEGVVRPLSGVVSSVSGFPLSTQIGLTIVFTALAAEVWR